MSIDEYFGDWMRVLDRKETMKIMGWLKTVNPNILCPSLHNIFKAFRLCSYKDCKIIMIFQDPYPQINNNIPVATGIPIGNSIDTPEEKLSPSLQILKESVINLDIPHNFITFDNSLETWAKQGILMLNSALTCEVNKIGSHINIWRPFISKLIRNISNKEIGMIYVLFGKDAQSLKPYINDKYNHIIETYHPAYFARNKKRIPNIFMDINNILKQKYNEQIIWFKEENYGS